MRRLAFWGAIILLMMPAARAEDFSDIKGLPDAVVLEDGVVGGGIPAPEALAEAAARGIKAVIDLRSPEEGTAEEEKMVLEKGMSYFNVPVTPENLDVDRVNRVALILEDPSNRPALIHCSTGNRVGAIWALYAFYNKEMDPAAALGEGIRAGLIKPELKKKVRDILDQVSGETA